MAWSMWAEGGQLQRFGKASEPHNGLLVGVPENTCPVERGHASLFYGWSFLCTWMTRRSGGRTSWFRDSIWFYWQAGAGRPGVGNDDESPRWFADG